jgi:hypothetical protein|tara:strand:+ start:131 stop:337 length:207 start_codon:yes stop_codon:yes gene_type:complete
MDSFEYDHSVSDERNFRVWQLMNSDEREGVGQAPLQDEEARVMFNELRDNGWLMTRQREEGQGKSASS